jgi:hypothetical protein
MRHWIAVFAALALAGCDAVIVSEPVQHNYYTAGEEDYAARNGAIRVEVAGDTFGMGREEFANEVVAWMRGGYYRHDFFTREASRATDPRYKIVMMFNPDPAVSGTALCAAAQPYQPVPPAPGGRTSLLAAFCGRGLALSEAQGWVPVSGVRDPKLAELITRVTNSLFPKFDVRQSIEGTGF